MPASVNRPPRLAQEAGPVQQPSVVSSSELLTVDIVEVAWPEEQPTRRRSRQGGRNLHNVRRLSEMRQRCMYESSSTFSISLSWWQLSQLDAEGQFSWSYKIDENFLMHSGAVAQLMMLCVEMFWSTACYQSQENRPSVSIWVIEIIVVVVVVFFFFTTFELWIMYRYVTAFWRVYNRCTILCVHPGLQILAFLMCVWSMYCAVWHLCYHRYWLSYGLQLPELSESTSNGLKYSDVSDSLNVW